MTKRYRVTLEAIERGELEAMISRGKAAARKLAHARVLLLADQAEGGPGLTDADVAAAVCVSVATVERGRPGGAAAEAARAGCVSVATFERGRQRFVEQGLDAALAPKPTSRVYART